MTAIDYDRLTTTEIESMILLLVVKYHLRVDSDLNDIKYLVDLYHMYQTQMEEAVEALKRENGE